MFKKQKENYESTGIIHHEIGNDSGDVFFVPDAHHYVKHNGGEYAVFLGDSVNTDAPDGGIIRPFEKNIGCVRLSTRCFQDTAIFRHLAMKQNKINVKVEEVDNCLCLISITVPALPAQPVK